MKPRQEIVVKIVVLVLLVFLLLIEILVIDIRIVQIVVTLIAVLLTLTIVIVEIRRPRRLCDAFIYKHKENGSLQYCENDQGDETRDFRKLGEGKMPCDLVDRCSFAN